MSRPKKHHYLPISYQNGFCKDGRLWLYDLVESEYRCQAPKVTGVEKELYTFVSVDGEKNSDVEGLLSDVENSGIPALRKLVQLQEIDRAERSNLATFVALLRTRVPEFKRSTKEFRNKFTNDVFKKLFSTEKSVELAFKRYEADTGVKIDEDPKVFCDYLQECDIEIEYDPFKDLEAMLDIAIEISHLVCQMNWTVLLASQKAAFVCSDNPFVVTPPFGWTGQGIRGFGIRTPGAKKLVPLTAKACLLVGDKGGGLGFRKVNSKEVRGINLFSATNAERFIIARDEKLLRSIVKKSRVGSGDTNKRLGAG